MLLIEISSILVPKRPIIARARGYFTTIGLVGCLCVTRFIYDRFTGGVRPVDPPQVGSLVWLLVFALER